MFITCNPSKNWLYRVIYKPWKKKELEKNKPIDKKTKISLLSSFQHVVVETVIDTILDAAAREGLRRVVCGGGVFANRYLRSRLQAKASHVRLFLPPLEYTTDNAAIVAGLGFYLYNKGGIKSTFDLEAQAH